MGLFELIVIDGCLAVALSTLAMREAVAAGNGMEMKRLDRQVIAPSSADQTGTSPVPAEPMWVAPW